MSTFRQRELRSVDITEARTRSMWMAVAWPHITCRAGDCPAAGGRCENQPLAEADEHRPRITGGAQALEADNPVRQAYRVAICESRANGGSTLVVSVGLASRNYELIASLRILLKTWRREWDSICYECRSFSRINDLAVKSISFSIFQDSFT
jgi:hypothetical protein